MSPFTTVSRHFFTALLGVTLLAFAGCHSAEKPVELPAAPAAAVAVQAEPAVSGDLSRAVAIVPGTYQVSTVMEDGDTYKTTIKVKVRFLTPTVIKAGQGYNNYGPVLMARLLDASGAPIDGADRLSTRASYAGGLAPLLKQGQGEEWLTFDTSESFHGYGEAEKAALPAKARNYLALLQGAKKISLASEIEAEHFEEKAAKSSASASAGSLADGDDADGDCDAFLTGYEEYVNDYVALAREMQADPTNAALLTKSSAMAMKAAQWAGKAKGCENDPDFQAKYAALSTKMAMGMAGGQ